MFVLSLPNPKERVRFSEDDGSDFDSRRNSGRSRTNSQNRNWSQIKRFSNLFDEYDKDSDGVLQEPEWHDMLNSLKEVWALGNTCSK